MNPIRRPRSTLRDAVEHMLAENGPPRVLLAEDDDDMRGLIASALRADGLLVTEVSSGTDLLDRLASMLLLGQGDSGFDLIVSDVRMPGKSGLEVLGGLRRSDWSTPVVLITAFGDHGLHDEARRLGAAAVLDKPFDIHQLRQLVRELVMP